MTKKRQNLGKAQKSLFDTLDISEEEKKEIKNISHENHTEDSIKEKNNTFDFEDFDDELKNKEDQNLRSEQIFINDPYYNQIFSILCRHSKGLSNSSTYEIKQSQKENFDYNGDKSSSTKQQRELRLKISDILKYKNPGYHTNIYQLLDIYFRTTNNENYVSIPAQSAQQIIKLTTDAIFSNERSKEDYHIHPWDYTGPPGDLGYKKEGKGCIRGESISILTNQQCHIEKLSRSWRRKKGLQKIPEKMYNFLTFSKDLRKSLKIDSLNVDPILTRLSSMIDLRHVRIIPLYIGYKIEIVYKKVISEKLQNAIEKFKNISKDRYMGIDIGINNTMAIGCLDLSKNINGLNNGNLQNSNNIQNQLDIIRIIGNHPILIIGKYLKSINQWFNKKTSELYSIYYRQQGFKGKESKGQTVKMGKKFRIISRNRDNFLSDIFHKLSNFVIRYCLFFRIGTIIIDWSKGIKQNMDIGRVNNQNFAYIPYSTKLIRMMKYKARFYGIKVIIQNGAYTSVSSFPDNEPFDWIVKNIKNGGLKDNSLGRISRGMFVTNNGLKINDDIMSSYNQIRKYRITIGKGIPNIEKINGLADGMLRPICLRIEKLLSEGSKYLISMIHTKKPLGHNVNNLVKQ